MTRTEVYLKYQNIARRIASDFSKKYNRPYEQMVECAEYALCLELFGRKQYRSVHGTKRSTWLYTVVYFHMKQVCTRGVHPCPAYPGSMHVQIREWVKDVPFSCVKQEDQPNLDPVDPPTMLSSLLSELGEEARMLVKVIFEAPAELADFITVKNSRQTEVKLEHARRARDAITSYLIDQLDWSRAMVNRAWIEVQECLT